MPNDSANLATRQSDPARPEDDSSVNVAPAWLTYRQAESYSSLSRGTIWKLICSDCIEAVRVGRAVRINRDSLEGYLKSEAEKFSA